MTERHPPLTPWPLDQLLTRVAREWTERGEIFGLSGRRFFKTDPDVDLSVDLGGHPMATPVGPAAGPHTQLAQNIVLAWLAGARSFELKTVQVLDELDIARPCIDMENVGYNIEWSQELTLTESLHEYVKAWVMLAVLRRWEPLREVLGDPGEHVFELSVGYDLPGVQSDTMTAFIQGLLKADDMIAAFAAQVPATFGDAAALDIPGRIVGTATISTFHGCPPEQVEGIVQHLMTAHGLDVTVKLNPTLLGEDAVREILHDRLGYTDIPLVPEAFAEDLQFPAALDLITRLRTFGAQAGRVFGIKLTNTLVVENLRGVMPGDRMYLSGRPLHVLAVTLLDRLMAALPGELDLAGNAGGIPVAFSAGVDKDNLGGMIGLGLAPVTICSDLLKPGGYGRLAQGLRSWRKALQTAGWATTAQWRAHVQREALAAGHRDAVQAAAAHLKTVEGSARYTLAGSGKPLRQVDNDLQEFECVACGNCVSVCPNNAFFTVPSGDTAGLESRNQYLVLAELCNECGNCVTFCPEKGEPQLIKPRLFTDPAAWTAWDRQGYFLDRTPDGTLRVTGDGAGAETLRRLLADGADLPFRLGAQED